ncbi:dextrin dextranase [Malassezia nana]|uniref:Mannosyltransferase n=1 Tax=Malassezia nana TaxID=180528 RepID=A0AAF0EN88_9BASI|nr:dextrin dextranase [Malassezia nana]
MPVADCDEVYNYWEPVHLLAASDAPGKTFQTWEYAPQYAIRSWAYIALHAWVPALANLVLPPYAGFFTLRVVLAAISSVCDTMLYDAVARHVNVRTARYTLVFLAGCAGMVSASSALLPSTFVMYTTSVAMAWAMAPAGTEAWSRTWRATLSFAVGALAGWPFGLVIALPYVWEELFLRGCDTTCVKWRRATRWLGAVLAAALVALPILLVDSLAYGRIVLVPLNTVLYNVLGRARGIGPELYGVEPPSYYVVSLLLAFSVVVPLALLALPAVIVSARYMPDRFGPSKGTHSAWLLSLRILSVYLWMAVLVVQPHKEERFMYPIYPLLCVNAAICLYLMRAAAETVYLRLTRSPYRASHTMLFSALTLAPLLIAVVLGLTRTLALIHHYRAPLDLGMVLSATKGEHRLCYGKEWHRFPSHFFVPPSMQVDFIESEFDGILPHHFAADSEAAPGPASYTQAAFYWPRAPFTQRVPSTVNERNQAERDRYVRAIY